MFPITTRWNHNRLIDTWRPIHLSVRGGEKAEIDESPSNHGQTGEEWKSGRPHKKIEGRVTESFRLAGFGSIRWPDLHTPTRSVEMVLSRKRGKTLLWGNEQGLKDSSRRQNICHHSNDGSKKTKKEGNYKDQPKEHKIGGRLDRFSDHGHDPRFIKKKKRNTWT